MNCRTLEYIVAVKETGSVQQAAQACSVTVGTISGQITRLESYLGTTIFKNRTQPAEINQNSRELYELISATVENIRQIKLWTAANRTGTPP